MHRVACLLLLAVLSACGQSGDLYLRSEPPPAETPAAAASDPPAPQEKAPAERPDDKETP